MFPPGSAGQEHVLFGNEIISIIHRGIKTSPKNLDLSITSINPWTVNKYTSILLPVILLLAVACSNNGNTKKNTTPDTLTAEQSSIQKDTAALNHTDNKTDTAIPKKDTTSFINRSNVKTEDFIKQYPGSQKTELKQHIERLRKEWKHVSNPFIATYQGNNFGDYMHILFKDAKGTIYDFGQADNNYGQYKLFKQSGQYEDNPQYLGKKFNVYWEWKLSGFLCCEGDYGKAKAYIPAITKLELIKH